MKSTIPNDILIAALAGYRLEQQRLEEKIAQIQAMLDGNAVSEPAAATDARTGKRKKRSAAVRRRMAEAQKARWAKLKGQSEPVASAPEPPTAKRKLSEAGRNAIVAATKKRWAMKRAAAKATVTKTKKKVATKKSAAKTAKKAAIKASVPAALTAGPVQ